MNLAEQVLPKNAQSSNYLRPFLLSFLDVKSLFLKDSSPSSCISVFYVTHLDSLTNSTADDDVVTVQARSIYSHDSPY